MADERDDDDTKSSKRPKKRFQEREDDDEEDDRPKKKRQRDEDDEDDRPRSKRMADDDADDEDERPKKKGFDNEDDDRPKKRRRSADDGPRVKTNDGIPVLMLLAFIGSAVALFASCVGCGWFSFGFMFGGGDSGGGGGGWGSGNEFEVVNVSRREEGVGFGRKTAVSWTVKAAQNPSNEYYFVVVWCGGQTQEERITIGKGSERAGSFQFPSNSGQAEVWVERRPSPFGTGKKVSNTQTK